MMNTTLGNYFEEDIPIEIKDCLLIDADIKDFKVDRVKTGNYVTIYMPEHPRAINGYVLKHIVVMETVLKRYVQLPEVVHHIDGNKNNNNIDNLMLFPNNAAHIKYHKQIRMETNKRRSKKDSDKTKLVKCAYCKVYDNPSNMYIYNYKDDTNRKVTFHRECRNQHLKNKRQNNQ